MKTLDFVSDLWESDNPHVLPELLKEEYDEILHSFKEGMPVIHNLKLFAQSDPRALPQAGFLLARLYIIKGEYGKGLEWMNKVLAKAPGFIDVINKKAELLIELEDYDAVEAMLDFTVPFEQQFPDRRIVTHTEYGEYELNAIRWLLINQENEKAVERTRAAAAFMNKYLPLGCTGALFAFQAYVPEDEYTPEMKELISELETMVEGTDELYEFDDENELAGSDHPFAVQVIDKVGLPDALSVIRKPREQLVPELRELVEEAIEISRHFVDLSEISTHQVWISLLMLACLDDPNLLHRWDDILFLNDNFIEEWLGDALHNELFFVGYKTGLPDPKKLFDLIDPIERSETVNISLITSLCCIAWTNPDQQKKIIGWLTDLLKSLMQIHFRYFTADHRAIVTELLRDIYSIDPTAVQEFIGDAFEEDRVDLNKLEKKDLNSSLNFGNRFELKLLQETAEEKLKRIYTE